MHPIDPNILRKAAEQLHLIDEAGYGLQLERELSDATVLDNDFRHRDACDRWHLTLAGNEVDAFAKRLAKITDCPFDQARGVALDLLGYGERRAVGLKVLAELSHQVRRVQSQAARKTFAGRRSA